MTARYRIRWRRGWGLLVAALVLACPRAGSAGFTLLDDRLSITAQGFTQWSMATSKSLNRPQSELFAGGFKQGDLAWQRNSLQIETHFRLADEFGAFSNVAFHFTPRLVWHGETDVQDRIPSPGDFGQSRSSAKTLQGRNYFENVTFRDAYLTFDSRDQAGGDWAALLGQQQVVWGESDGFRLADTINPLDLSWHYFLENFEDLRVPILMARVFYFPHRYRANQAALELVWKPAKFEGTDLGPVYDLTDPRQPRTYWAFPNVVTPGTETGGALTVHNLVPDTELRNGEAGLRGAWVLTGQDWAGQYLNGTQLHAYYLHSRAQTAVGQLASAEPLVVNLRYPRQNFVGFQFNQFLTDLLLLRRADLVFRGEFLYTPDAAFQSETTGQILKIQEFQSVLGLERPTSLPWYLDLGQWIGLSPPGRTTFFAAQWFLRWRDLGGEERGQLTAVEELPTIFTFFAQQRWLIGEELQPQVFFVWETEERHGLVQPSASYRHGNHLIFTLGSNLFFGDRKRRDGFFGPVLEKDEVYFKTTFQL